MSLFDRVLDEKVGSSSVLTTLKKWLPGGASGSGHGTSSTPAPPAHPAGAHIGLSSTADRPAPTPSPGASAHTGSGTFSTRHKPGSVAHTVHLFKQARELAHTSRVPVHVVQHGPKRYVTARPHKSARVIKTFEEVRVALQQLHEAIGHMRALDSAALDEGERRDLRLMDRERKLMARHPHRQWPMVHGSPPAERAAVLHGQRGQARHDKWGKQYQTKARKTRRADTGDPSLPF